MKKSYRIATIGKMQGNGHAWYRRMESGVQRFRRETGHHAFFVGPTKVDGALQKKVLDEAIAQEVDAICIVPFLPQTLELSLRLARNQGMMVIGHEASTLRNSDYNLEAFDGSAYGRHLMDHLATAMHAAGDYAVFLGNLSSISHSEWANAAITWQRETYPKMRLITRRIEDHDDHTTSYEETKKLLCAHPTLAGILGIGMMSTAGAGRAIRELNAQQQVAVVGTGLVSACQESLTANAIKAISFWDPADAGYLMNKLAVMALEKQPLLDGMDLGVAGYQKIVLQRKLIAGAAWIDVTSSSMAQYQF